MATGKEQTLQVKDFQGISRYYNSTNQPPNKLYTCQNMYSPIQGELALVGGVTKLTSSALPGATSIKYIDFIKTATGVERLIAFFDHAALPTPSAPAVATTTGTKFTGNVTVKISYVGMGGESAASSGTVLACGGGASIVVTLPALPTGITAINVFVDDYLCAVVWKRPGTSYPASVTLTVKPVDPVTANKIEWRYSFSYMSITYGTGGALVPGKIYYFGLAPSLAIGFDDETVVTTKIGQAALPTVVEPTGRVFSFSVPEGFTSASISLSTDLTDLLRKVVEQRADSAPYEWTQDTSDIKAPAWVFLGLSPNDLMAVGSGIDGVAAPQVQISNTGVSITIKDLPCNHNLVAFKQGHPRIQALDYSDAYATNILRAKFSLLPLYERDDIASPVGTPVGSGLGAYALQGLTYDSTTDYQLIPPRGQSYYSPSQTTQFTANTNLSAVFVPSTAGQFKLLDKTYKSAPYINRLYFANGEQSMMYTNGYVLMTAPRKSQTPWIPITKEIVLFNDRIILGGGANNPFNTQNVVYYSASGDPETWTATPGVTAGLQFVSTLEADGDEIVGFGVYSESLSTQGISAFLVIGKKQAVYTWSGSTSAGAQIVTAQTGFASSRSFFLSNIGPGFVGRRNVYRMSAGGKVFECGNDVREILRAISDTNISSVTAVYHEDHVKIGYTETSGIDRELWLRFRQDDGNVLPIFTGPHQMKSYTQQIATNSFAGVRDVRLSFLSNDMYKRDDFSSYLNDGSNIAVALETNDLSLGAEEFLKVVNSFKIKAKVAKAETLTLSTTMYDSSSLGQGLDYSTDNAKQVFSDSMVIPYAGSGVIYRTFPKQFTERYVGSLLRFAFTMSTNVDFRIQIMSWLFSMKRRRLV